MQVGVNQSLGESAALARPARGRRAVAEEATGEVQREALFADAGAAVEEQRRREPAAISALPEHIPKASMPDQRHCRARLCIGGWHRVSI